jgi:hypothetical protein
VKKRTVLLAAAALSATLMVVGTTQAFGYNLTGARWPNANRTVTISVAYSGTATGWNNGMSAWNATPTKALFTAPGGGTQTIVLGDANDSSVSWDGISNWNPGTGTILNAQGRLNYAKTKNYSANTIKGVAAHELGHILGLAHHNGCYLMTDNTGTRDQCSVYTPQSDDQAGINALY